MASNKIFFGIELEFYIAYLPSANLASLPADAGKITYFTPTPQATHDEYGQPYDPLERHFTTKQVILEHVCASLVAAGHPAIVETSKDVSKSKGYWRISKEDLVELTDSDTPYRWYAMELSSPALAYSPESIAEVLAVANFVKNNYVVRAGGGLHIHVSAGQNPAKVFDLDTLRRLLSFLWCFSPQLDTLHEAERQDHDYCLSWRTDSSLEQKLTEAGFTDAKERNTMAIDWLFGQDDCLKTLYEVIGPCYSSMLRFSAYNITPAAQFLEVEDKERNHEFTFGAPPNFSLLQDQKPTIEFRQHKGCLEEARISHWIRLVGEIIRFCQECPQPDFEALMEKSQLETWEKWGDEKRCEYEAEKQEKYQQQMKVSNSRQQKLYGPCAAEGAFTVIQLLEMMRVDSEVVNYYRTRVFSLSYGGSLLFKD